MYTNDNISYIVPRTCYDANPIYGVSYQLTSRVLYNSSPTKSYPIKYTETVSVTYFTSVRCANLICTEHLYSDVFNVIYYNE